MSRRFPHLFSFGAISHDGPTKEQAAATKSITTLIARGYASGPAQPVAGASAGFKGDKRGPKPDREIVLRITGPDPGYSATAIFLAQAGISVLLDRAKLPSPGVHTVSAAEGKPVVA